MYKQIFNIKNKLIIKILNFYLTVLSLWMHPGYRSKNLVKKSKGQFNQVWYDALLHLGSQSKDERLRHSAQQQIKLKNKMKELNIIK